MTVGADLDDGEGGTGPVVGHTPADVAVASGVVRR